MKKRIFLVVCLFAILGAAAWFFQKKFAKASNAQVNQATYYPKQVQSDSAAQPNQEVAQSGAASPSQSASDVQAQVASSTYLLHKNISVTYFGAGEPADDDNKDISNAPSAWDDDWEKHFGGVDDPQKRNGLVVANFVPKENSFYFALPYNDFDENGNRKSEASKIVPWASSKKWGKQESMLKNQWIKITKDGKDVYAQWEDVGPFNEDDAAYVFGSALPKSKTNKNAGLDVSPSVKDYLNLSDIDKVDWQFVSADQVPDGPWKKTVTASQIFWN